MSQNDYLKNSIFNGSSAQQIENGPVSISQKHDTEFQLKDVNGKVVVTFALQFKQ